jgi:hypothetical protein
MTTPANIITLALKDSGVLGQGQTASAEDTNDAFTRMNQMIAQWARKRWLIYHLITVSKTSTGAQSYTVGPNGDFNTPRPDKLESAFLRQIVPSQPNLVDYPLMILPSREDYNQIPLKTLGSFPQWIFYDSAYPLGSVYPWPIPQANIYALHLTVKDQIAQFTSLAQTIDLPPEYEAALLYNLAWRLRPAYQLPPDPTLSGLAIDSLNVIRNANAQIPMLTLPRRLVAPGGKYNIFGDYSYS